MNLRPFVLSTLIPLVVTTNACQRDTISPAPAETSLQVEAARLAHETVIVDTHIDLPYRLNEKPEDVSIQTEGGHFDYVRATQGGLDAAFMSVYVPASLQDTGGARALADKLIDLVEQIEALAPDKFAIARSVADVRSNFDKGLFSLPLGIENGAAIEDELANLDHFYDRGVRYVTLSHSESNLICDSSYSEERQWDGLSPFGHEVVDRMNRLGMMVDISHVTDETFLQVIAASEAPVIASHSCVRTFTPGFERNMTDDMITMLADRGGVINIGFAPGFLTEAAWKQSMELRATIREYMKEHNVGWGSEEVSEQVAFYYQQNPRVTTSVSDVVDHMEHVIDLVGIDHVGLGSDFDGISSTPRRGYGEQDIRKICGENLLRVWAEVEKIAQELQES
jgi:membrane dipeptidase